MSFKMHKHMNSQSTPFRFDSSISSKDQESIMRIRRTIIVKAPDGR